MHNWKRFKKLTKSDGICLNVVEITSLLASDIYMYPSVQVDCMSKVNVTEGGQTN